LSQKKRRKKLSVHQNTEKEIEYSTKLLGSCGWKEKRAGTEGEKRMQKS